MLSLNSILVFYFMFLYKDSANESKGSLLTICRVQPIFYKDKNK
ncbi:hypothetical protein HMPREF3202_01286 [Prevotella bivia]|uniref:Uncharacterized protein n=1 Tax=Prevotella bivia TaxID=28125 RepID=A0A137SXV2_9BACT|nr:hypothetical protein HMPREF3202_01286 [Prevotella bivia]